MVILQFDPNYRSLDSPAPEVVPTFRSEVTVRSPWWLLLGAAVVVLALRER